jgi:alginate O-acetyltransferase complex protein AlgI
MLFNSLEFIAFLPLVFAIYWGINGGHLRLQNAFVLLASYVFYGWWDYRFLILIVASTVVDFVLGLLLGSGVSSKTRKYCLAASLVFNLGLLGIFKYFNFFAESLIAAFDSVGVTLSAVTISVILPVGISFYTFQTLSYTLDVYKRNLRPTKDFVAFASFVAFFPQLVAGPIERASNLLPQFLTKRKFDYKCAVDGCRQILWGFAKKIIVADNCAVAANTIFRDYESMHPAALVLGMVFFAFQIYCDFSGYSDIAIGVARLFGFELMANFRYPYFSRDIAEFWRRWHISLSTWFRDYVYIPLGGSRGGKTKVIRNVFAIFLLSGLWHGANWTFISWGAINALYFLPLLLRSKNRDHLDTVSAGRLFPTLADGFRILRTFSLVCLGWVFFRAETIDQAVYYISGLFTQWENPFSFDEAFPLLYILPLFVAEWSQRNESYPLAKPFKSTPLRWAVYLGVAVSIVVFSSKDQMTFIYFQF